MRGYIVSVLMMLVAIPAYAQGNAQSHALTDGLVLHVMTDADSTERLKRDAARAYSYQTPLDLDAIHLSALKEHHILSARYRTTRSVAISEDGQTMTLDHIQSAPSPWAALPARADGAMLVLQSVYETLANTRPSTSDYQLMGKYSVFTEVKHQLARERDNELARDPNNQEATNSGYHDKIKTWGDIAKACDVGTLTACFEYLDTAEIEITLKNAKPITLTLRNFPGC